MSRHITLCVLSLLLNSLAVAAAASPNENTDPSDLLLRKNWFIQSSSDVHAEGAAISSAGFLPEDGFLRRSPRRF